MFVFLEQFLSTSIDASCRGESNKRWCGEGKPVFGLTRALFAHFSRGAQFCAQHCHTKRADGRTETFMASLSSMDDATGRPGIPRPRPHAFKIRFSCRMDPTRPARTISHHETYTDLIPKISRAQGGDSPFTRRAALLR